MKSSRSVMIISSAVLSLLCMAFLASLDVSLRIDAAPYGILSFEFAGTGEQAGAIVESWRAEVLAEAGLSLGFDFLFLLSYGSFLLLSNLAVADALAGRSPRFARTVRGIGLAASAAPVLDAIENTALILLLLGAPDDRWASLALLCALPKFALVLAALASLTIGWVALMLGASSTARSR